MSPMPIPPSQTADAVDLGPLLDGGRWTGYQKWLVLLTAIAVVSDGVDNQLLGVSIPTMIKEWSVPRGAPAAATPLVYNGYVYCCARNGGMISCFDAKTGAPTFVEQRLPRGSALKASPIAADGQLYVANLANGRIYELTGPPPAPVQTPLFIPALQR